MTTKTPPEHSVKLNGTTPRFGGGLFHTGVIDPPWPYQKASNDKKLQGYIGQHGKTHYDTLTIADMAALPVGNLIDGYLFLWCSGPWIPDALALIKAWGFDYITAIHWYKRNPSGKVPYGPGYWYRASVETILLARKPGAPAIRTQERNVFEAARGKHSAKPEAFQDHVERHFPGPYVELFARRQREGWTCLGDECPGDGDDIRVSLPKLLVSDQPVIRRRVLKRTSPRTQV
jgi:N6-adenosine-specific RNA methylase IME4